MDVIFQVSALSVLAAVCCCILRPHVGSVAVSISIVAGVLILLVAFRFFKPIIEMLEQLRILSGLSGIIAAPLIKVVGIGILTQIAGSICDDAGERTLHQTVEIAGNVLSVYVSIPLLSAVLDLLEGILHG